MNKPTPPNPLLNIQVGKLFLEKISVNLFIFFGLLLTILGSMITLSNNSDRYSFLHNFFVSEVAHIDYGIQKLRGFEQGKNTALDHEKPGFKEILSVIRKNDGGIPKKKIYTITNRQDYKKIFYGYEKGSLNVIHLDLKKGAKLREDAYPVAFDTEVFQWIDIHRVKVLIERGFRFILAGFVLNLIGCILSLGIKRHRTP